MSYSSISRLPPRGTGLFKGTAGARRGIPRTYEERLARHATIVGNRKGMVWYKGSAGPFYESRRTGNPGPARFPRLPMPKFLPSIADLMPATFPSPPLPKFIMRR